MYSRCLWSVAVYICGNVLLSYLSEHRLSPASPLVMLEGLNLMPRGCIRSSCVGDSWDGGEALTVDAYRQRLDMLTTP